MTLLDQAIAQMRADGMPEFPPGHPMVDAGRITRYGPKKSAWYRLWSVRTRAGTEVLVGAYGDWKSGLKFKIEPDWKGVRAEEVAEIRARMREAEELERKKREDQAGRAANRARGQWESALSIEDARARGVTSPYLERKRISGEKCRIMLDGTLLVPARILEDDGARLVSLQKIAGDGTKRFNKGAALQGASCILGAAPVDGEPILVCEGYATAGSIRLGVEFKRTVVVAFNATNLIPVVARLRARYPRSPIIICADDDWKTEVPKGTPFNPGKVYADRAARAAGNARVIVPLFIAATREDKWSDFNDLHIAHGIDAVAMQLDVAKILEDLAAIATERELEASGDDEPPPPAAAEKPRAETQVEKGVKRPSAPPVDGASTPSPPGGEPPDDRDEDPWYWIPPGERLHTKPKTGLVGDLNNVELFLLHHPEWEGVLGFDLFGEMIVKLRPPPYHGGSLGEWTDLDDARTQRWLSRLMSEPPSSTVRTAVQTAAHFHEFNKVRDYLEACHAAWDRSSRLKTWLIDYLGVGADFDELQAEERDRALAYVELVGVKWLISGVARVMNPGCRVDTMLILEGDQGLMKSTALRTLGGDYFSDARLDFTNKDTLLLLQGRWIIEMPELEGMNKADSSETKRFLTQHEDIFRPPYGQKLTKAPRRCIFAGTVNHDAYLKDDSGNRRFWPVRVTGVDLERLGADRDQLWGEALELYRQGVPWWPTVEERPLFEEQQDARYVVDPWDSTVRRWLDGGGELVGRKDRVTFDQILGDAIGLDKPKWDKQAQMRVGSIMRRLQWKKGRSWKGGREYYYERPEAPADVERKKREDDAF